MGTKTYRSKLSKLSLHITVCTFYMLDWFIFLVCLKIQLLDLMNEIYTSNI